MRDTISRKTVAFGVVFIFSMLGLIFIRNRDASGSLPGVSSGPEFNPNYQAEENNIPLNPDRNGDSAKRKQPKDSGIEAASTLDTSLASSAFRHVENRLREIEKRNTTTLYSKISYTTDSERCAIAISCPSLSDLAEMSDVIGEQLKSIPKAQQDTVKNELRKLYGTYSSFASNYRLLYVQRKLSSDSLSVMLSDAVDISSVPPPTETGFSMVGQITVNNNKDWWKNRYSHLIELDTDK